MSFSNWMNAVDNLCLNSFGMSIHDLPDMCFRDAYDDGMSPQEFFDDEVGDLDMLAGLILS